MLTASNNSCSLMFLDVTRFYMLDTAMLKALYNLPKLEELHGYYVEALEVVSAIAFSSLDMFIFLRNQ